MTFSELKECPFCGNDEFYSRMYLSGYSIFAERFDGAEAEDNSQMYDMLHCKDNGRRYCRECGKYLGNAITDTLSAAAKKGLCKGGAK